MTTRARLWLDLALFGGLVVAYNPASTGLAVHEWLCLAAFVPLLFHVVINWDQTLRILSRFAARLRAAPKVNLVVDAALFVAAVTVMLSGLLISQTVAGAVGITIVPAAVWVTTHAWSADATMALLLLHFALHWRWIVSAARRLGSSAGRAGLGGDVVRPRAYMTYTSGAAVPVPAEAHSRRRSTEQGAS